MRRSSRRTTSSPSSATRVIVGGISAGSMLALRLTALRPEKIHGLMLFSPTFWPNGWAIPWYFSLFRLVQQKWTARLFKFRARAPHGIKDDRLRSFILDSVQSETDSIEDLFARGGGLVLEFRRLVRNVKPLLGLIKQHALVFHPRNDDQSDLSQRHDCCSASWPASSRPACSTTATTWSRSIGSVRSSWSASRNSPSA